ncbi:hypothetical protein TSAR_001248 [Trichomalopsis sarcophagae]|uniref:Uncharacterized protein n=1 Tax=Trichomalopsis sarcophagae TaxID=543379 RepID=A0A232EM55_9HYME|nr:hypothetical protein TSAR_001248 [Trichomalopsis sarcophagae]
MTIRISFVECSRGSQLECLPPDLKNTRHLEKKLTLILCIPNRALYVVPDGVSSFGTVPIETDLTGLKKRFCRPIAFEKETEKTIIDEYSRLISDIEAIVPHEFIMSNKKKAKVTFIISTTIFDGKCVNTIVGNPATSSHRFNELKKDFTPNEGSLKLGLGFLHVQIKAFEHLLQ